MVSLFFSPLLPSSDATSEDTWTTSADYKAAYTGSWLPCQKQPLIQSQFGHPYSPVTMPCWADLKVANMSGHKKNTKNTNPSSETSTLMGIILSKRSATAQVSVLFSIRAQVLERTYFIIKGGKWEHWPNSLSLKTESIITARYSL